MPIERREAVAHLREHHAVSERRACRVLGADRTAIRYRPVRPDDAATRARLRALAGQRRRFADSRDHRAFEGYLLPAEPAGAPAISVTGASDPPSGTSW